nr:hypothetical protein [Tanacetum cinerariifolium]
MSAMANTTPIVTTVAKPATNPRDADATPRVNIQDFCEEYYEDILPIIMDMVRRDKRKKIHARLDFEEGSRETRAREDSHHSSARTLTARPERLKVPDRLRYDDRHVLDRLGHRRQSAFDQLSETYSSSTTKSRPCKTNSRDHPRGRSRPRRLDASNEGCPEDRKRFCGVGESYDDSNSHSYHDRDRSRHMKRRRDNESPLSSVSKSDSREDPFTPQIHNFESSCRTRMPNNVKTYDETGDLEDHVKIFQAAAQVERWAMPTWCHMFNSTLIGADRVWFDELPSESVDSYKDLKAAFLAYFMQQKKYVKDPVEIHNIKQKDGESIEDFMERFKVETGRTNGAPECMRISGFMHREKPSLLAKRKVTNHGEHRTSQKGKLQKRGLTFEVIQEKEGGLTSSPPYKDTKRNSYSRGSGAEGPLVIEAEIDGHMIHSMYVDGGSSMEILYQHFFNRLRPEVRNQMIPTTTSITSFSGETIWPMRELRLLVTIGDADHSTRAWTNFMIVRSLSPYNGIIGRPGIKETQAVLSTAHGMLKFPVDRGIVTIHRSRNRRNVIYEGRTELCSLLKENLDIFAWQPSDMTRVPRSVAEHRLNIREGYSPVRQKKRGQVPERAKAIQAEVQKLVEAGIMREVYYHDWLSNPVMLAESDEEKTAFHTGQGVYCYIKMPFGLKNAGATYQRLVDKAFHSQIGRNIEVYVDDLVVKSHTEAGILRDVVPHVQSLNEKLASLNKFLSKSAKKSLPLFKTLKKCIKKSDFHWTSEAKQAFNQLKKHLSELPLLVAPKQKEELIVYMSASYGAISAVLMTKKGAVQKPVYFVSYALQGLELNYTPIEKLVLSLVFAAKRLRSVILGEHNITYRPRTSVKGQVLADFLVEVPDESSPAASVFAASNNKAEYEALIAGLRIAAQMGVQNVHVSVDSKLVANQVLGTYVAKEENMIKYLEKVLVEILKEKSIQEKELTNVVEEDGSTWMTPIMEYLKEGTLPSDRKDARKLRIKARQYELLEGVLYRRSFLAPWLRCVGPLQAEYVIREIHKGSCSMHAGPRQVKKFMWDNIVCRFGLPGEIVSNNGKQFSENPFKYWCDKLNITQRFASVKHPQSNGLVERANRSLGEGIKARLEIGMPLYRTAAVDVVYNDEEIRLNMDFPEEQRERAAIREAKAKLKITKYYNARVYGVTFRLGDFVYRSNDATHAVDGGKL